MQTEKRTQKRRAGLHKINTLISKKKTLKSAVNL